MKKSYFIRLFIVLLLCLLLALTAIAHPGRLDSNGGHYVRSPGHGYPVGSYHYHDGSSVSVSSSEAKTSSVKIAEETTPEKQISKIVIELNSDLFFALQNSPFIDGTKYVVPAKPLNGPVINSLPVVKMANGNIKIDATDTQLKSFIKFSYQVKKWIKYQGQPNRQPIASVSFFDKIKNYIKPFMFFIGILLFTFFSAKTFFHQRKVSFLKRQISQLQSENLTLESKAALLEEDLQQLEKEYAKVQEYIKRLENSLRFRNNQICFLYNKTDKLEAESKQLREQLEKLEK